MTNNKPLINTNVKEEVMKKELRNAKYADLVSDRLTTVRNNIINIKKGIGVTGQPLTDKAKPSVLASANKEKNALLVIEALLAKCPEGVDLMGEALEAFNHIVNPASKGTVTIALKDGDNLLLVIQAYETAYPHAKGVSGRVIEAVTAQGFVLDGVTIRAKK